MTRVLGIDAGKAVVRTALVRTSYRRIEIEALAEIDVAGAGSERDAIRAAAGAARPDAVAIAISGERAFYRRLDLPAAAQKELANVLGFELEATVPFEMSDAVYDHRALRKPAGSQTIPIFAVVARTEDVKQRIRLVREALGVEPERVGAGALPLANLCAIMPDLESPPPKASPEPASVAPSLRDVPPSTQPQPVRRGPPPVAIVEVGETSSDVVVLVGGEPQFARTLSRGTAGLPASAPALARELRQTIAAWRAGGGAEPEAVYLVGGGAFAQGADAYLGYELGLPIRPLPPPRVEGLTPEQAATLPRYAKALGLALELTGKARTLNLRRGPLEAQRSYPFLREKVPILSGLTAVIGVSFVFSVVAEMRSLEAEHEVLLARLAAASRDVLGEETTDPDRARDLLEHGPGTEEDPLPAIDAFDVMVQLSKSVPKDVVHDVVELDVARAHAVVQGTVPANKDAEGIAEKMKEHRCFKDVKILRTSQFTEGKQKYVLDFDLRCEEKKKKAASGSAEAADTGSPSPGAPAKSEGQR